MSLQTLILITGVVASVGLGSYSNYIYDILKRMGFFPDKPTVKTIVRVIITALPFICVVVFPTVSEEDKLYIKELLQKEFPLWLLLIAIPIAFLIGYLIEHTRNRTLNISLEKLTNQLEDKEKKLDESEKMLGQYISSKRQRPRDSIIRPK
jgi:hypothetical protein